MENIQNPPKSHKSTEGMLKYLKKRYKNDPDYKAHQIEKAKSKYEANRERYKNDPEYRQKRIEHSRAIYAKKKIQVHNAVIS